MRPASNRNGRSDLLFVLGIITLLLLIQMASCYDGWYRDYHEQEIEGEP